MDVFPLKERKPMNAQDAIKLVNGSAMLNEDGTVVDNDTKVIDNDSSTTDKTADTVAQSE